MDRYVDIRGWTSGPLHGRKSRPCASWYLHAFARADAVLIQVDSIAWNVLMFPVQDCFSFLYIAFGSIPISYFLEDPVFWQGTAPFSLLPSDATGISSLRWRLAPAQ